MPPKMQITEPDKEPKDGEDPDKDPQDSGTEQDPPKDPAAEADKYLEELKGKAKGGRQEDEDPAVALAKAQEDIKILQAKLDRVSESYIGLLNGSDDTGAALGIGGSRQPDQQRDILAEARKADGTYFGGNR